MVACFSASGSPQLLLGASGWLCPGGTSQAHTAHLGWLGSCRHAEVGGKLGGAPAPPHYLSGEVAPWVASIPDLVAPV